MATKPIEDIEAWSKTLSPWRQDCLRRLAVSNELTSADHGELLALIKASAGFTPQTPVATPVAFTAFARLTISTTLPSAGSMGVGECWTRSGI